MPDDTAGALGIYSARYRQQPPATEDRDHDLVGLAALPASGLIREAAAQGALPHVDEKETLAVSLAYVQDVTKVDPSKTPQFKPGSHCGNSCSHQLPR